MNRKQVLDHIETGFFHETDPDRMRKFLNLYDAALEMGCLDDEECPHNANS